MSKHRSVADRPGRRRAERAGSRRRFGVLAGSLLLTAAVGWSAVAIAPDDAARTTQAVLQTPRLAEVPAVEDAAATTEAVTDDAAITAEQQVEEPADPALPADSGEGRRIVFDEGDQRVWLVGDDGEVERTYPVSGSRFDNLDPGSYTVLSRTRHATSFDYSGTMEYFVHFTTGWSAPIGFHSVPVDNAGQLEQTEDELGTPLSAGCIRQWMDDAKALWDFAPVGTPVVVTA